MTTNNTYRIYIRSNEHPRTINTPMMARSYYSVIEAEGTDGYITKLNELVARGEKVLEVRKGFGGAFIKYWEHINK
jgi:hypothetical protein